MRMVALAVMILASPLEPATPFQSTLPTMPFAMDRHIALAGRVGDLALRTVRFKYEGLSLAVEIEVFCAERDQDVSFNVELLDEAGGILASLRLSEDAEAGESTTVRTKKRLPQDLVSAVRKFRISVRVAE